MASPGDGDSQAPAAPSAGNDLGKRKRNSVSGSLMAMYDLDTDWGYLYFCSEPVIAAIGTLARCVLVPLQH
jgi:hypothetical protein